MPTTTAITTTTAAAARRPGTPRAVTCSGERPGGAWGASLGRDIAGVYGPRGRARWLASPASPARAPTHEPAQAVTTVRPSARAACAWRRSKRQEANPRRRDPLRGRQVEGVERPHAGRLGDRGSRFARCLVELDDRDGAKVIGERGPRGGEIASHEEAGEVSANLDDRVPGGQERAIGSQQRVSGSGIGLLDVPLEQGARVDVGAHSPRSSARTSSTRRGAFARRTGPSGAPVPGEIQPSRMPPSIRARPGTGPSTAFGRPRSVTRRTSPRSARSRYSERRCQVRGSRHRPCGHMTT